jgi:site-specific recombinase XerD
MINDLAITTDNKTDPKAIIQIVLDGMTSENSKRAYEKALTDFLDWYVEQETPALNKATVQRYKTVLQESGLAPSSINQRMSAIRKLAQEAADNGFVDQSLANGVARVKGVKSQGVRTGNWLAKEQAQKLINSPDISTLKGLRDRAILAIMIGAGLRRSEVANLTFDHIQQREGRWVIVDLIGKGNRVRTVPMPAWAKVALEEWTSIAGINSGKVFRRVNKGDNLSGESMTPQAVRDIVINYSDQLGNQVAAHDLRRTFAKLAYKGGSGIDQIQLSLGHASIKTTEKYLGVSQNLTDAPCDRLGIRLE